MRKAEKDYLLNQFSRKGKPLEKRLGTTGIDSSQEHPYRPGYQQQRYGGSVGHNKKYSTTKRSKLV